MEVSLKVFRFNPEIDKKWHYETYQVEADPTDTVLDLLEKVKGLQDGALAFRRSCAHGVCGSDAMRINGRNHLACKTLVHDLGSRITIEPLMGLKVIKDLIVDMDPFFDNFRKVLPYFINNSPLPDDGRERLQTPEQHARIDETTKCILCGCCTASCPSFWSNEDYLGPAALVNAHRFIFDSRDEAAVDRLKVVDDILGVYRCHTAYNCTDACPRDIPITKSIGELKRAVLLGRVD
jgi:succinate dehydrogenase / fumarate reductase iron-sulfur subunit